MLFFGVVEGGDGSREIVGVELAGGFGEEAEEGVGVQGQRFGAVREGFLGVIHLWVGSQFWATEQS